MTSESCLDDSVSTRSSTPKRGEPKFQRHFFWLITSKSRDQFFILRKIIGLQKEKEKIITAREMIELTTIKVKSKHFTKYSQTRLYRPRVNCTNVLRAAFMYVSCARSFFCAYVSGLYLLAYAYWRKSCTYNVDEIEPSSRPAIFVGYNRVNLCAKDQFNFKNC